MTTSSIDSDDHNSSPKALAFALESSPAHQTQLSLAQAVWQLLNSKSELQGAFSKVQSFADWAQAHPQLAEQILKSVQPAQQQSQPQAQLDFVFSKAHNAVINLVATNCSNFNSVVPMGGG